MSFSIEFEKYSTIFCYCGCYCCCYLALDKCMSTFYCNSVSIPLSLSLCVYEFQYHVMVI